MSKMLQKHVKTPNLQSYSDCGDITYMSQQ